MKGDYLSLIRSKWRRICITSCAATQRDAFILFTPVLCFCYLFHFFLLYSLVCTLLLLLFYGKEEEEENHISPLFSWLLFFFFFFFFFFFYDGDDYWTVRFISSRKRERQTSKQICTWT